MKKTFFLLLLVAFASCKKDLGGNSVPPNVPSSEVITGTIRETVTLTSDRVWKLKGYVYVTDGASLIIEPGTVIQSDVSEKGALCIERGSKIIAEGTRSAPIVFTSGKPIGERRPGDWGGIIILGKARTNRNSDPTIEGGIGRQYGGSDDEDNSGVLKFVRIEYAGIAAVPNSEINGLTLGAVGRGTTIEYVQTVFANDDAFEFFGGTVSPKYLYAYATADDDFDFDFGFTGVVSNSISKRLPNFVDNGDAGNGVECDNDGTGSPAIPTTRPTLIDVLLIGPNDSTSLSNHNFGMRFRRASNFHVERCKVLGYMKAGVSLESTQTAESVKASVSVLRDSEIQCFDTSLNFLSRVPSVISSTEFRTLALSNGNTEPAYSNSQLDSLSRPSWTLGWTRFPRLGD